MRAPTLSKHNLFKVGSSTMRYLLAVPPDVAQDRLFQIVSSYQIVQALVLSGAMGIALNPIDHTTLAQGKETFALLREGAGRACAHFSEERVKFPGHDR